MYRWLVWRSGNGVGQISKVKLRQFRKYVYYYYYY